MNVARFFQGWTRMRLLAVSSLLLTAFLSARMATAQVSGEGTIEGTISDSTGAAIPDATVTATSVTTHASTSRTSSSTGYYSISPLPLGIYTVKVEAKGFETLVQDNLDVSGLNSLAFNPSLKNGATSETVTVTDAPPALDTDSANLGAVLENETYSNLPLTVAATQERDPTAFALLTPGAQPGTDGRLPSISGTPGHQAALYLDGVSTETLNQQGDNRTVALNVDVDAVDSMQVITSVPPAEYTGAGAENITLKSGTLHYHGQVVEIIRNTAFDTFTFSQKQSTVTAASAPFDCHVAAPGTCPAPKAVEHTSEFSAAGGGYIPHTGKKVFFFIAYDRFHGRSGTTPNFTTIPTALEEAGDFTQLNQPTTAITPTGLAGVGGDPSGGGANPAFLYDPTTNNCAAVTSCTRMPFQGLKNGIPTYNVIPTADLSPISLKLQSYLPNIAGSPNAGHANSVLPTVISGNYGNQGTSGRDNYNWDWRWDYDISPRNRISTIGAMGHDQYATNFSNFYNDTPYTTGDLPLIVPKVYAVEDAYQFSSHLTNQFKYGYTRFYMPIFAPVATAAYSPGAFGITNLPAGQGALDFPNVTFGTSNFSNGTKVGDAQWGANTSGQATQVTIPNNYALTDNVQWVKRNHVILMGFSYMFEGLNNGNPITVSNILPLAYKQSPTANYLAGKTSIDTSNTGYGYASFLLGAADPITGYSLNYNPTQYTRAKTAAPYVEDHWKVNRKLTIDAGLRWDYLPPVHEKSVPLPAGNFTFSYLNPNIANPLAGFNGALEFAGNYGGSTGTISCGCTTPIQTYWKNWGPRLGIIYAVDSRTVFSAGVGITYSQGGGTGGGQLSGGPAPAANSSGQVLGAATSISSPGDVTVGPTAGPSFWLSQNTAYLNGATVPTAVANTALGGGTAAFNTSQPPPTPGTATQSLAAGNYLLNGAVVTPGAMGFDDFYQSGRASEYTIYDARLQRSITNNLTVSVAYVGSEGHHAYIKGATSPRGYYSNNVDPRYLLTLGPVAGYNASGTANSIPLLLAPATSANLAIMNAHNVATPANAANFIAAANAFPSTSSLTIAQLLVAFPQYASVADSWGGPNTLNFAYNAFQFTLSQRTSHGLTFNINYNFSKDVGDDAALRSGFALPAGAVDGETQAWKADRIDRSRTQLDIPEWVNVYGVYELPFGHQGHWGGNSLLSREIIGGWRVSGIYTYNAGTPVGVTWSGGCPNNPAPGYGSTCLPSYNPAFTGTNARINGPYGSGPNGYIYANTNITKIQYLNVNAFTTPKDISTVPGFHQYLFGNVARTAPYGLRNEGTQNGGNASISRSFPLPHETSFEFQAEVLNLWNKQTFGGPSGSWSVGSTSFGNVGAPGAIRSWQFVGHIKF
jgi:hypothetical protein